MSSKLETIRESKGKGTINVGFGNYIVIDRVLAILDAQSLPMRRLRESASEMGRLLDATAGRKMRSLVFTDSGHIVLSALATQTLQERLSGESPTVLSEFEWREGEFVS